jgi:[ribosomal protein S5]-alanine N-acetyltransferase
MNNNLVGKKIYLREFAEQDWVDVHQYASQEKVSKYQPWGPNTEEASQAFVNQVLLDAEVTPRTRFVYAIMEKLNEKLIGAVELNIRDAANRNGEIGYIVHPDFWGLGVATEAAKLTIEFGFTTLRLHRIYATCDPRNSASSKILEKLGMTKEGKMRENLLIKDGWRDSYLYSVLDREWDLT